MIRLPFISFAVFLAISGCGNQGPVDPQATNVAGPTEVNAAAPSASGEPRGLTTPAQADPAPSAVIPASLQGRWGLAPRDCTAPDSAATGLLVITAGQLRFHDSHAVPASGVDANKESINGNFAFTGAGRSWTRYEALSVDNRRLLRTETNPPASFSYAKCS